jgi:hypothetical protein
MLVMNAEKDALAMSVALQRGQEKFAEVADNRSEAAEKFEQHVEVMKRDHEVDASEREEVQPAEEHDFLAVFEAESSGRPTPSTKEVMEKARQRNKKLATESKEKQ